MSDRQGEEGWLVVRPDGEPLSVAALLDDARALIIEARDEGVEPLGILVDPAMHDLLVETKMHQVLHGAPLIVLGFAVAPIAD